MGALTEEKIFMIKSEKIIIDTNILIYSKIKVNLFFKVHLINYTICLKRINYILQDKLFENI